MVTKANSKLCQTSEVGFLRRLSLASEANSESCKTSEMELFAKIFKN